MKFKKLILAFFIVFITYWNQIGYTTPEAALKVRVLVNDNNTKLNLLVQGPFVIKLFPSGQVVKKSAAPAKLLILPSPAGIRIGKEEWTSRGISIEPLKDRTLFLESTRFRGSLQILKDPKGLLDAVNTLDVEGYLYGVLHHEVAHWWPMEALKAQAVAARTYALYQVAVSKAQDFDLKSGTSSQMYGGSTVERFRTKKAVNETRGQILTYQGKIFPAYFHATCAGTTAGADELWQIKLPPLAGGVNCNYCLLSPHHDWQAKIALSEIEEKLNSVGRPVGQILKIEVISQTPSHRAGSLRITGTQTESVIAAKDFRVLAGGDRIRSTNFTVTIKDDQASFVGKGWGHGVGLCQWGALGQALTGRTYHEILNFYYPGADIRG